MENININKIDETTYNAFWSRMQQFKFDIIYYCVHFNACININRRIKYFVAFTTAIFTGIWMTWHNLSIINKVCGAAIIALQAVSVLSELFPYEKRKNELRELTAELEPLYIEMENDWRKIYSGEVDNEYVKTALDNYLKKQIEIKNHYFKDDTLPEKEKYRIKADNLTEEYFKNSFI